MKTWRHKVLIPKFGICTVKEATDEEITGLIAPVSHGFVNLYQNDKRVGFCGIFYAQKRIIKKEHE